jgi:hypothetical protein
MAVSDDDRIISEMLAPDVEQALESLGYWLERHRRLPARRFRARAESRRMIGYWQSRAIADVPRAPLDALANAGAAAHVARLAAGYHARRTVNRFAGYGLAVVAVVALIAAR